MRSTTSCPRCRPLSAGEGIISHRWSAPFTVAGVHMVEPRLRQGERVDYAPTIAVIVQP